MVRVHCGVISLMIAGMVAMGGQMLRAEDQSAAATPQHVLVTPGDLKWQDGPSSLPAGVQMAVTEGDPKQAGLFTMRLKMPANYHIPAHWHPVDEHVTVISGTFNMGMGDVLDTGKGTTLPAGSFAVMPAEMRHFAWTTDEVIIQLHGVGPWGITYVNSADDPRS